MMFKLERTQEQNTPMYYAIKYFVKIVKNRKHEKNFKHI